jgi:hypothetical protein
MLRYSRRLLRTFIDFYLDQEDKQERIIELAKNRANAQIMPYIFEALREFLLDYS